MTRPLDSTPPAAGAVVMGTGIVSMALRADGQRVASAILLALAAAIWLGLAALLGRRAWRDRGPLVAELSHPAALSSIAGTAVLGTRLTTAGWAGAGAALLVVALGLWAGLVPHVLRHWETPTIGASFLLGVATDALGVLAAGLAVSQHAAWLAGAALAPFGLSLGFYAFVLSRFQLRQLAVGRGDHWVAGGALAISTLAIGRIAIAFQDTGALGEAHGALKAAALVLWGATMAWLPALIAGELLRPRLGYDLRRWSTVFPLGMYAACSFTVGDLTGATAITDFAQVWVWVALAVWVAAFAATLRRARAVTGHA
jgi:tellurite resistance protein TehA-like permease